MLSSDDHPGIFVFLVGIIVLVMVAVGLSSLVDRRFRFSSRVSGIQREAAAGEMELERMRAYHLDGSRQLAEAEPLCRMFSEHESTCRRLEILNHRRTDLIASRDNLQTSVQALDREYSRYRTGYRDKIRAAARGEVLGNITIPGGREYRGAVIKEVTDESVEIRHEYGTARLQALDLDPALQERFQLDVEAHRDRAEQELIAPEADVAGGESSRKVTVPSRDSTIKGSRVLEPDVGEVNTLRAKVRVWKSKVSQLDAERNQALSSASYGTQSSVPGSLETWRARASRLARELSKARTQLAAAKADLAEVAPHDPLLRPETTPR